MIGYVLGNKKVLQPQNSQFWKAILEVKKLDIFALHASFYNIPFNTEAGLAKRVVKPILETNKVNDLCLYV